MLVTSSVTQPLPPPGPPRPPLPAIISHNSYVHVIKTILLEISVRDRSCFLWSARFLFGSLEQSFPEDAFIKPYDGTGLKIGNRPTAVVQSIAL